MTIVPHKTCTRCGQSKPLDEFGVERKRPDGHAVYCKACRRDMANARYQRDPDVRAITIQRSGERAKRLKDDPHFRKQVREAARRYIRTERGKLKNREKARRNFHDNPKTREYLLTYQKKRRKRDPEFAQKSREYRRIFSREWKRKNPEAAKKSAQKQHDRIANNPSLRTKYTEYQRVYRQNRQRNDPAYHRHLMKLAKEGQSRRSARLAGGGGSHTEAEWLKLCAAYDHCCVCCGEQKPLTEDHILAVINGGSDNIENLQPLCETCNKRKGTKTIDYRY